MKNKYVNYISDEHLLNCIANLHKSYLKAKSNITKQNFYNNKVDTIKLTFDAKFNNIGEESLIQTEVLRQIDKSINNSIGTFHEQILGGIKGFQIGKLSGFDLKAKDDSLFAVFGKKEYPKNITDSVFGKLSDSARIFLKAKFYYVLVDDYSELNEKWVIGNDEYSVSQKRVFEISIKEFYTTLTGQENSFNSLISELPLALKEFFSIQQPS